MATSLSDALFWVAVACCAAAQLLILRAAFASHGARGPAESLPPVRRAVEVVWAVIPALALALLLAATWRAMHPPPDGAHASPDPSALSATRGGRLT
jgi:heme/copper-type cytochrome/quinol oxidase subunit 2